MARSLPTNRPMGAIEWLLLIALSVLWGGTFLFAEIALAEVRPFTLVLGRVGIAALILLAAVYLTGHRMPGKASAWRPFLIMGALNNLFPFSLIFWGQTEITGRARLDPERDHAPVQRGARPLPDPRRAHHRGPPGRAHARHRRRRRDDRA
jgi:hypothetical protein